MIAVAGLARLAAGEDPLHDEDSARLHPLHPVGAVVDRVVVGRDRRPSPGQQVAEVLLEQVPVERGRVVIIRCGTFGHGLMGASDVVAVEPYQAEALGADHLGEALSDRRLP